MNRTSQTHRRDAALRRLRRARQMMAAGSVLMAGLVAAAAARTFPATTAPAAETRRLPGAATDRAGEAAVATGRRSPWRGRGHAVGEDHGLLHNRRPDGAHHDDGTSDPGGGPHARAGVLGGRDLRRLMTSIAGSAPVSGLSSLCWPALGCTATVRAPPEQVCAAAQEAVRVLGRIDRLASRFRPDSELTAVNRSAGRWTAISPELADLMSLALWAAEVSEGAVDPTLGEELSWLGYDRDFAELAAVDPSRGFEACPAAYTDRREQPWRRVGLSGDPPAICLPQSVSLDLGAIGKGHAADLAARAAHARTGGPVLIALGGDIAVAGQPPTPPWSIGIAADHRLSPADCAQAVHIRSGGLATSSLLVRRWRQGDRLLHHVLDPRDGLPVSPHWVTATVAARTCAEANVATTASLVLGPDAPAWLQRQQLPARLVALDGSVLRIGQWPA